MKSWLYVNAKVVCIAEKFQPTGLTLGNWRRWHLLIFSKDPKYMEVCTITDVWERDGELAVKVAGYFPAYRPRSFQPLQTVDTTAAVAKLARLTIPAGRKVIA